MRIQTACGIARKEANGFYPITRVIAVAVRRHERHIAGGARWRDHHSQRLKHVSAREIGQRFGHYLDALGRRQQFLDFGVSEDKDRHYLITPRLELSMNSTRRSISGNPVSSRLMASSACVVLSFEDSNNLKARAMCEIASSLNPRRLRPMVLGPKHRA